MTNFSSSIDHPVVLEEVARKAPPTMGAQERLLAVAAFVWQGHSYSLWSEDTTLYEHPAWEDVRKAPPATLQGAVGMMEEDSMSESKLALASLRWLFNVHMLAGSNWCWDFRYLSWPCTCGCAFVQEDPWLSPAQVGTHVDVATLCLMIVSC